MGDVDWRFNVDFDEYLKYDALSASTLKKHQYKSRLEVEHETAEEKKLIDTGKRKSSKSKDIGTLIHLLLLEPKLFEKSYFINKDELPKPSISELRAKKLSAKSTAWLDLLERAKGRKILTQDQLKDARECAEAAQKDSEAMKLINNSWIETSIFWTRDGVKFKARPDLIYKPGFVVPDLKTAVDVTQSGFSLAVNNFGYDISGAHYLDAVNSVPELPGNYDRIQFICLRNERPYRCEIYELTESHIYAGRQDLNELIRRATVEPEPKKIRYISEPRHERTMGII